MDESTTTPGPIWAHDERHRPTCETRASRRIEHASLGEAELFGLAELKIEQAPAFWSDARGRDPMNLPGVALDVVEPHVDARRFANLAIHAGAASCRQDHHERARAKHTANLARGFLTSRLCAFARNSVLSR